MAKKRIPKSLRKFIRREKARIRRDVLDIAKQRELIAQIYSKFLPKSSPTEINNKIKNQNAKIKTTNPNAK